LTAETVIEALEDPEDYKAFELSVTADFDASTTVERELVLRLASLLWRLRRVTAIETGLFQIQSDILQKIKQAPQLHVRPLERSPNGMMPCKQSNSSLQCHGATCDSHGDHDGAVPTNGQQDTQSIPKPKHHIVSEIARCFLRLANVDNGAFERASRYETALWRQVGQILFTLDSLRRKPLNEIRHPKPTIWRSLY
jgi:hypothetical protein